MTVGQWLTDWFESYVKTHTSPRTHETYWTAISRHLIPGLGALPLAQLQPQDIQAHYAHVLTDGRVSGKGGLSAKTVLLQHRILHQALAHAVRLGVAIRNPAEVVEPPRPKRPKLNYLNTDQANEFLEVAGGSEFYVLFALLLFTGMRRGEAMALRWGGVDLLGAEISISETAFKLSNGTVIIKEPKTPHSRRAVDMPPSLAVLLRHYRADQEAFRAWLGGTLTAEDFLFANPDGTPLNPNLVTTRFRALIKRAGLPHVRLHDLRHTHATLMLKAGVHPKIVSERLGHASVSITLDTYSHVLPGLQKAAAERFDQVLSGVEEGRGSNPVADAPDAEAENTSRKLALKLIQSYKPHVPPGTI